MYYQSFGSGTPGAAVGSINNLIYPSWVYDTSYGNGQPTFITYPGTIGPILLAATQSSGFSLCEICYAGKNGTISGAGSITGSRINNTAVALTNLYANQAPSYNCAGFDRTWGLLTNITIDYDPTGVFIDVPYIYYSVP